MSKKMVYKAANTKEIKRDLDYEDCEDMFEEGLSDSEISRELDIDERYVKTLRDEYQKDY